jgi:hypothetical protein
VKAAKSAEADAFRTIRVSASSLTAFTFVPLLSGEHQSAADAKTQFSDYVLALFCVVIVKLCATEREFV